MKKIICILLVCMLLPIFASCVEKPDSDDGKFTVVCSIFPQYDFCRIISGGLDEVILLQENGVDMHSYEATSRDILRVAKADMLIYTGGGSDTWVEGMLRSSENENIVTLSLFDCLESDDLIFSGDGHEHGHEHHHKEGEICSVYDEHVWTSPENAISIVRGMCDAMCSANPKNTDVYRANAENYIEKLGKLGSDYKDFFEEIKPTLIIADRFPFVYLTHEYGVAHHAAFSGCSSETGASFEVVMSLIDEVRNSGVGVVFDVDGSGSDVARRVAESTGAELKTLYSCQSVTQKQLSDGESYLSFMEKNLQTLKEAYKNVNV